MRSGREGVRSEGEEWEGMSSKGEGLRSGRDGVRSVSEGEEWEG